MRICNMERCFHGTCLNLTFSMGCSQFPSSLCLKYAEKKPEYMSDQTKRKIEIAKELGLYSETVAAVILDVPCDICNMELVDAGESEKVNGKYVCWECQ